MNSLIPCRIYPRVFERVLGVDEVVDPFAVVAQATQRNRIVATQAIRSRQAPQSQEQSTFAPVLRRRGATTFAAVDCFASLVARPAQKLFSCVTGAAVPTQEFKGDCVPLRR